MQYPQRPRISKEIRTCPECGAVIQPAAANALAGAAKLTVTEVDDLGGPDGLLVDDQILVAKQDGKNWREFIIAHESLHALAPQLTEDQIDLIASILAPL